MEITVVETYEKSPEIICLRIVKHPLPYGSIILVPILKVTSGSKMAVRAPVISFALCPCRTE